VLLPKPRGEATLLKAHSSLPPKEGPAHTRLASLQDIFVTCFGTRASRPSRESEEQMKDRSKDKKKGKKEYQQQVDTLLRLIIKKREKKKKPKPAGTP
jgi:hypothetical protein